MRRFLTTKFVLIALGASIAYGQTEQKPLDLTFDVLVEVVGTAAGERREVPGNLTGALESLRPGFGSGDYGLVATYIQRTSNSVEYKGPLNSLQSNSFPKISEWAFRGIRRSAENPNSVVIDGFRFGMRVPIGLMPQKSERPEPSAAYEWFGFSSTRFKLTEGETTLVGSLESGDSNATLFVFLTVRAVER